MVKLTDVWTEHWAVFSGLSAHNRWVKTTETERERERKSLFQGEDRPGEERGLTVLMKIISSNCPMSCCGQSRAQRGSDEERGSGTFHS